MVVQIWHGAMIDECPRIHSFKEHAVALARINAVSYTHLDVYKRQVYNTPSTNGSCQFKVKQKALPVYKFIYKEDALNADAGLRCGVNTWKEEAQKDGCAGHVVDSLFKYLSLSISSLKHIHPVGGQSTW